MTLPSATTTGPNGPGNDGNEGVLRIPQRSSITDCLDPVLDCLVSYLGHSLLRSYPSPKKQSVYSSGPADCK